jgi:molybdenum cofactor biosynthesis protein B
VQRIMSSSVETTPDLIRVSTLTFSDTRTKANDEGGRLLGELLVEAGFFVVSHEILREEPTTMREAVLRRIEEGRVSAIVTTGGTGIAPRDQTIEAIAPLFDKTIEGFGEAFRRLSWDAIGPRAILSRATAGTVKGRIVIALPGSLAALRLAVDHLIRPTLPHMVALAHGKAGHHDHGESKA